MYDKLIIFRNRLKKLRIEAEYFVNFPWLYLDTINGKKVLKKFHAEHGFTIAFLPIKSGQEMQFTDLREIFKLIRRYATKNV